MKPNFNIYYSVRILTELIRNEIYVFGNKQFVSF